MPTIVLDQCSICEKEMHIKIGEYRRAKKQGRAHFFCSRSCSAKYRNTIRPDKRVEVEKECLYCGLKFKTLSGAKSKVFCSRSCASAGSVTAYRRERARVTGRKAGVKNLIGGIDQIAAGLRSREAWKYREVETYLKRQGITHEFEHVVGDYIFDLVLLDEKILVEFDGLYHTGAQLQVDQKKEAEAKSLGWEVRRVQVQSNQVILVSAVYGIGPG